MNCPSKPAAGRAWLCAVVACVLAAQAQASADSLYARIGGEHRMTAIVHEFAEAIWVDPQLAHFYTGVTRSRFEKYLAQQFCDLAGGGCTYAGDTMRDVHAGLMIEQKDFYRLVEILRDTLRHQGVATRERNELLALLAPMKRDIVERK